MGAVTDLTTALLDPILAADPAGPRITYYDDATGERIELSAVTLANWAAKTANFLSDEFALVPGARVSVLLPAHWQTAAVLLGAWWAGLEVTLEADPDADAALVTVDRLDDVADVPEVAVLSLDAFGRPVPDLPVGVTDYATAVRVHGDQFRPSGSGPAALDGRGVDDVLSAARSGAAADGVTRSDRVLSTRSWSTPDELIAGLVSVLAVGASLVQVANPDADAVERRVGAEKITTRVGG
ncbi:TIGR03089 family protein [Prescottella equi]|uniref:TIGR03089 family protein n=1 Tax=Rhodococcus hoagii TaxID=43767 RepID=A0AAE4ZI35_RHOHA|nr:TIGR03089 family protein [Prescottella equi]MBM4485680.1 TIGR03089 family protein [Prescottella equi]MBM9835135.1 TIGR03089 family protein [Prescottella equi]NKR32943.1 TIGR03089 family protein [Prescottella equi]NKS27057.1 TIGR03089 family protein [Prescottella equi]NKS58199.1 TIGR03089 family protein [Prescottella equi]